MNNWLKLIGSSDKPITEHPFYGNFNAEYIGFRKARMPGIRMGDHLLLYAPGGSRSIFALAEAVADPENDDDYNPMEVGSCRWKLRVQYLINLSVASGVPIDEVNSGHRNLTHSVRQQSHIKLTPEEYKLAYSKLQEQLKK
jgi:hypothetical protein